MIFCFLLLLLFPFQQQQQQQQQKGFIAAGAGAVEAVMTMEEVNDRTETENEAPNQYLYALSLGNAVGALFGTMGGGANIPMSVLAIEAGANGRFRISGLVAGFTLFLYKF